MRRPFGPAGGHAWRGVIAHPDLAQNSTLLAPGVSVRPRLWPNLPATSVAVGAPDAGQRWAARGRRIPSWVTTAPAGTDCVTQQLPPTTAPRPTTVSPPRMVAPA